MSKKREFKLSKQSEARLIEDITNEHHRAQDIFCCGLMSMIRIVGNIKDKNILPDFPDFGDDYKLILAEPEKGLKILSDWCKKAKEIKETEYINKVN